MRLFSLVPLIAGFLLLFFTACFSFAADQVKSNNYNLVDIVYEWNVGGNVLQVGDYMIDGIGSVYEDRGKGELVQSSKKMISVGSLVKAVLVRENENDAWKADRIIIYSGDGLLEILQSFSEERREVLLNTMKSFNNTGKEKREDKPEQKEPHLENGVWVN